MKRRSIICNWKTYVTFNQAVDFCEQYRAPLVELVKNKNIQLIICPAHESLSLVKTAFKGTSILVGAQDCSPFPSGAHTGDVSAASLAQIGCDVCLIGHSELKKERVQKIDLSQKKIEQLYLQNERAMSPVICVGESLQERERNQTWPVIEEQLTPLLQSIVLWDKKNSPIYIAYEPVWAIGTGVIPDIQELRFIFVFIQSICKKLKLEQPILLLYGGSVNEGNIASLCAVESLDGFLIGNASIDFQKLKTMVSLIK